MPTLQCYQVGAPGLALDAMTSADRAQLLSWLAHHWATSHYKDNLAMVAFLRRLPILRMTSGEHVAAADATEAAPLHCCPPSVFQPPAHTPLLEWRDELVGLYGAVGVVTLGDSEVLAAFVLPAFTRMSATGQVKLAKPSCRSSQPPIECGTPLSG